MDEIMKESLGIVRAQAGHRVMTADEIVSMIISLHASLMGMMSGSTSEEVAEPVLNPKKSIKEKTVTCLECGKTFKVLTQKHLSFHGLTGNEYRAKYGMKKGTPLVAKSLARDRKNKMAEMKLWERRKKVETPSS